MPDHVEVTDVAKPDTSTQPRLLIGIFCEGETEKAYLTEIASALKIDDKVKITVSTIKEPGKAFDKIAASMLWNRQIGEEEFSEVWLVFDRDSHSTYHYTFEIVKKFPFVHLAFSNPCIEFWFLSHCPEFNGVLEYDSETVIATTRREETISDGFKRVFTELVVEKTTSPDKCYAKLKSLVPTYAKTGRSFLNLFGSNTERAIALAQAHGRPNAGHGTDVPKLIERLIELSDLSVEGAYDALRSQNAVSPLVPNDIFLKDLKVVAKAAAVFKANGMNRPSPNEFSSLPINIQLRTSNCKEALIRRFGISAKESGLTSKEAANYIVGMNNTLCNNATNALPQKKSLEKLYTALSVFKTFLIQLKVN